MAMSEELVQALRATSDALILLDQRKLPTQVQYLACTAGEQVIDAIRDLAVRGAPAIGIAGVY
jgi:methylthioribose-1-phosphate isomerase